MPMEIGDPHPGYQIGEDVLVEGQNGRVTAANHPYYDVSVGTSAVRSNLHYAFMTVPGDGEAHEEPLHITEIESELTANRKPDASRTPPEPALVEHSYYIFDRAGVVRSYCTRIMKNTYFDNFILFLILVNTIFMAGTDFKHFDPENGDIRPVGIRNKLVIYSEPIFVSLFALEFTIKSIALGFISGKRAYIKDSWNRLDFIVVVASVLEAIPQFPKLSMLRCFRVLRPLRSISRLPKLKMQIQVLIGSIHGLSDVLLLILSFIFLFALFGVQLWGADGRLHGRCRSSADPLRYNSGAAWSPPMEPVLIGTKAHWDTLNANGVVTQCVDPAPGAVPDKRGTYGYAFMDEYVPKILDKDIANKADNGVYNDPRNCGWPMLPDVDRGMDKARLCNLGSDSCPAGSVCGSNYDDWGRPKFADKKLQDMDLHVEGLNWGLSRFDNILWAVITVFQVVTLEGWSEIMYMVQDATNKPGAYCFFTMIVLGGSFFMLNLALAIVFNVMTELSGSIYQEKAHELIAKIFRIIDDNGNGSVTFEELTQVKYYHRVLQRSPDEMRELFDEIDLDGSGELSLQEFTTFSIDAYDGDCELLVNRCMATHKLLQEQERDDCITRLAANPSFQEVVTWRIEALYKLVTLKQFDQFITMMIIANIVILACDRVDQPQLEAFRMEICSFVLTIIFGLELVLKLLGLGLKEYFSDNFNTFDAVITTLSIMEVCISAPEFEYVEKADLTGFQGDLLLQEDAAGGISALRTFRLFRLVRLLNKFEKLKEVTDTALMMMPAVSSFFGLVAILIFILALFGEQLLANKFRFDQYGYEISYKTQWLEWRATDVNPTNFDDLLGALLATFQIVTGEDWNVVFYDAVRADGWLGGAYVLLVLVIGSLLLLNLLIAVMLDQFERARMDKQRAKKKDLKRNAALARDMLSGKEITEEEQEEARQEAQERYTVEGQEKEQQLEQQEEEQEEEFARQRLARERRIEEIALRGDAGLFNVGDGLHTMDQSEAERPLSEEKQAQNAFMETLPEWRKLLYAIVISSKFNFFIFFLIFVSSVCLAAENPLYDPSSTLMRTLEVMDYVLTGFFVAEMLIKMLALGLWANKKHAYFRDVANCLDFFIVVISLVTIGGIESLNSLRVLRALRALRPLRMVSRSPSMRVVLSALIQSIPHVTYVSLFIMMVFSLFAILAVSSLKGTFSACQGDVFDGLTPAQSSLVVHPKPYAQLTAAQRAWAAVPPASVLADPDLAWAHPFDPLTGMYYYKGKTSRAVCLWLGADWGQPLPQNFDNVLWAFLTLFQICTTEGWVMVMQAAMDSTGIDMQPIYNANRAVCLLFVAFMLVCGIFMINLFVGVLVDNFARLKSDHLGHSMLLTEEQEAWLLMQKMMIKATDEIAEEKFIAPAHGTCVGAFRFCWECSHIKGRYRERLDSFISVSILVNVALLASTHFGQPPIWGFCLEVFNVVFVVIFTVEATIKIVGLGFWGYWKDNWNRFDFLLVVMCDIGLVVALSGAGGNLSGLFTILRVLRVLRFVRVLRTVPTLKALITTIVLMLPSLVNISALMLLMFFIYAVLGVQLFAEYGFRVDGSYNEHANFRSFDVAMMTLLRAATGEYWNGIMHDLADPPDGCQKNLEYDATICGFQNHNSPCVPLNGCGKGSWIPLLYFTTFCVLVTFVFLNLFITVILEAFENSMATAKSTSTSVAAADTAGLTSAEYSRFCAAWRHFAQDEWNLPSDKFVEFMTSAELGDTLGFGPAPGDLRSGKYGSKDWSTVVLRRAEKLSILPDEEGKFFFDDAASGIAQLLLVRRMDLFKTLDSRDAQIEKLARSVAQQRRLDNEAKGLEPDAAVRQIVNLSSGNDYERQKEIRKRKKKIKVAAQQQELVEDITNGLEHDDLGVQDNPVKFEQAAATLEGLDSRSSR